VDLSAAAAALAEPGVGGAVAVGVAAAIRFGGRGAARRRVRVVAEARPSAGGDRLGERPSGAVGDLLEVRPSTGGGDQLGPRPSAGAGDLRGARASAGAGDLRGARASAGAGDLPGARPSAGAGDLRGARPFTWRSSTQRLGRGTAEAGQVGTDELDTVLVLELVAAALATGAALPRALTVVGDAVGGVTGDVLRRAGTALVLGATWPSAWGGAPASVVVLADALEGSWTSGASPAPALRARADRIRRERRRAVRTAAARLSVHLVLPLGACFLPAFVLAGLVPVVLSLADGLLAP
jgi:hypothetical protein